MSTGCPIHHTISFISLQFREIGTPERLVAGVLAGGCAALISCPAEVVPKTFENPRWLNEGVSGPHLKRHRTGEYNRARRSVGCHICKPLADRRNYRGVIDAGRQIIHQEGVVRA